MLDETSFNLLVQNLFIVANVLSFIIFMIKIFVNEKKIPQEPNPQSNIFLEFLSRAVFPLIDTWSHVNF